MSRSFESTAQGRYDRMTDTGCKLAGKAATNMHDFVKLSATAFKQRATGDS